MSEALIAIPSIRGIVQTPANFPEHVAIIMDGNGRWAQRRGLTRWKGHFEASKRLKAIIHKAARSGTKILTLYCFSTENWKRPRKEIEIIFDLFFRSLMGNTEEFDDLGVRLEVLGDISKLPKKIQETAFQSVEKLKNNDRFLINLCVSYGGRDDIIRATQKIARECQTGNLKPEEITEDYFSSKLATQGLPDPDLVIRTSGECRISNFLLWQIAYSELYITDTLWPDFGPEDYYEACLAYSQRKRRFGHTDHEKDSSPCP